MKYALQINSSPYQSSAGHTAYQFCNAAIQAGHSIMRVFFYHDAVYYAFKHATPPDDELAQTALWSELAKQHGVDLVVCISAAQRRGLLSEQEAQRLSVNSDIADGFRISGLGQLVEATLVADRFLMFG
jgi:tRNA 2-thiouridine synthesizing protein D